jgi:hypothetical protein
MVWLDSVCDSCGRQAGGMAVRGRTSLGTVTRMEGSAGCLQEPSGVLAATGSCYYSRAAALVAGAMEPSNRSETV